MSKKQFKSESKRLLDLMIGAIYTHREIFLRELISNASDAIDKLAYISLTDPNVGLSRDDFEISITIDGENRTLTVSDNGVGMTETELEQNLGVIAKSGSLAFKQKLGDDKGDTDVIGQFGVGFYSAFMVASKVRVVSRAYGSDTAFAWESTGSDGYTIEPTTRDTVGSDVILTIKPDTDDEDYDEWLDEYTITSLIKKYSDYIRHPIVMDVTKSRKIEGEDGKSTWEDYTERETVNSRVPLWQRPKSEVTDEAAAAFFMERWHGTDEPAAVISVDAEGTVTYRAMLFVPSRAPYDYYTREYEPGLTLYASGVMIMERCAELLPEHFRFVRGVVDSPDFTLNISREVLQHDRQLRAIRSNLERRVRSELAKLLEQKRETYEGFWREFGLQIKYGLLSNYGENREQLQDLLLFWSSKAQKLVTLSEYADAMLSDQQFIYYACGTSLAQLESLPQTELVRERGYDILLLTDEIDDFAMQALEKFGEKTLKSVRADDLGLQSDDEKHAVEESEKSHAALLDFVKESLGERVAAVKLSPNLKGSASALGAQGYVTLEMERYFTLARTAGAAETPPKAERVLELNADHTAFRALESAFGTDKPRAKLLAETLCALAELAAGVGVSDVKSLTEAVWQLTVNN
ncbi:MAG: molecular chaperone HtpG [Oscillospiraceae bacterium]|jgi:molecular chaperone HtpG|nr:molecular chaperone HtpG [Oscillospiraceae bacterium]